jgi:hypothetical protein
MKSVTRKFAIRTAIVAVTMLPAGSLSYGFGAAAAENASAGTPPATSHAMAGHDHASGMTMQHGQGMHGMQGMNGMNGMHGGHAGGQEHGAALASAGQDAFGAIQETVRMLEADPKTDWSKVDLEALRQHLIDMNEVTLNAQTESKQVEGGVEIAVTGGGRTLAAIKRMVPAHAKEIDGQYGWIAKAEPITNGVRLTVTSNEAKEVQHIRGLGFIGLLVSGAHHQPHHLAMAKGEMTHAH